MKMIPMKDTDCIREEETGRRDQEDIGHSREEDPGRGKEDNGEVVPINNMHTGEKIRVYQTQLV